MKKYHLVIATGLLAVLIYPSVTFASWWNPLSWFKKKPVEQPAIQLVVPAKTEVIKLKKTEYSKSISPVLMQNKDIKPVTQNVPSRITTTPIGKQEYVCRSETNVQMPLEYPTASEIRDYFNKLVSANPSISNLNQVRLTFVSYRDDTDPYKMGTKSGIPYTADQLNEIENSFRPILESRISYYSGLIAVIDVIIRDKQQDGCINAMTLADYSKK